VNQAHLAEVDKALQLISEAREFVERTARTVAAEGGDPGLVAALEDAEHDLDGIHGSLTRATYVPASREQLRLAG
jgi:hypothetical protein